MKTVIHTLILLCALAFYTGCKKDKNPSPSNSNGTLTINLEVNIQEHDLKGKFKAATATADSFTIEIYNTDDVLVSQYDYAIDMPSVIELEGGEYYVVAYYGQESDVGFEQPFLSGQSDVVQSIPGEHAKVSVSCSVQNSAVSIVYSQQIIDQFDSYSTQVSTTMGSLTFDESETRYGYFPPVPISVESVLNYETISGSQEKTLHVEIPDPQPGKHYEIRLDASVDNGELAIQIDMDESLETEVIEVNDDNEWLGALVITEIMFNPDALNDTEGEWFEVYNPTDSVININNMVIKRDQNEHVINADVDINPGAYYVLARADTAVTGEKYVYGTGISLTNTSGTLGLYTYGTDGSNGYEICEVPYGDDSSFPGNAAGTAIQLSSDALQAHSAKLGSHWCLATPTYETGDLGTPGTANLKCD